MSWIQSAFGGKASPIILFVILLLAIAFFFAAFLHLLVRLLTKRSPGGTVSHGLQDVSGAFQRQLQHLFHLHDSGLEQVYIDSLPVFVYEDIVGSSEPFDCAVCLCEFSEKDELRLLPVCSHAFHVDCIDKWLWSNSTCPLCRGRIMSAENPASSHFQDGGNEDGSFRSGSFRIPEGSLGGNCSAMGEKRLFSVRLGKFRSSNHQTTTMGRESEREEEEEEEEAGESSNNNGDDFNRIRRCYSMGSFQYVVASLSLQVAVFPSKRHDREEGGKKINGGGESLSVSKIWLWSKKGKFPSHFANGDDDIP